MAQVHPISSHGADSEQKLIDRAKSLRPAIAERRHMAHEQRRIPDDTVNELIEAGVFKACQPARLGGLELPFGAQTSAAIEIAKSCGSTGWIASITATHHWIVAKFDAKAQDDVWAQNADALVASAYSASEQKADIVQDGYRVSGRWMFSSGIDLADWCLILTRPLNEQGELTDERRFMLIPKEDFEIKDVWRTVGLRGTGSNDLLIQDVFVPFHRTMSYTDLNDFDAPGINTAYRLPIAKVLDFCVSAPSLGMAQGALEAYCEAMGPRTGVMMSGRLAENTTLQVRTAEASAEIDAAKLIYQNDIALIRSAALGEVDLSNADLVRIERNTSYVGVLARRAVARLAEAMGAKGLHEDNYVHRAYSDIQGACSHISMVWDANAANYGKVLLGLEPPHLLNS